MTTTVKQMHKAIPQKQATYEDTLNGYKANMPHIIANKEKHDYYKDSVDMLQATIGAINTLIEVKQGQLPLSGTNQDAHAQLIYEVCKLSLEKLDIIANVRAKEDFLNVYADKVKRDKEYFDQISGSCNDTFDLVMERANKEMHRSNNISKILQTIDLEKYKADQTLKNELFLFLLAEMDKLGVDMNND